ncbi:MAG: hypothetical protein AAF567_16875 [Actinomycetota bacterium]
MQKLHSPRAASAMLVAVALIAAACGGTDSSSEPSAFSGAGSSETSSSSTGDEASEVAAAASSGDSAGNGTDAPETIEDYLGTAALVLRSARGQGGLGGRGGFAAGLDDEAIAEEQRRIEVEIQRCMQAEGFTYTPRDVTEGLQFFLRSDDDGVSVEDYAATEGFGISTRFDAIFEGEVDLGADEVDANEQHLATLSEGERDAWQFALRGAPPERNEQGELIDPETGEVLPPGGGLQATGGCRVEAQRIVRGDFAALAELGDEFAALQERIDADPRLGELQREWSACMLDRGFDYADADEARDVFRAELRPLLRSFFVESGAAGAGAPGGAAGGRGAAVLGAIQAIADAGLSDEQEQELQQLQDLEIATAVASLECAGDSPAEIQEIAERYEAEFVEQNRAALEAFAN